MGQAKSLGSREERIARAEAVRVPPKPGLYISTREAKSMRLIVEDVTFADDEDEDDDDFFLVFVIDEASSGDINAIGNELDPDQWFALVEQYGLVPSEEA